MSRGICKGQCTRPEYEHKKIVKNIKNTPYKKCSTCHVCVKHDGIFCPCCNYRLSNRNLKGVKIAI